MNKKMSGMLTNILEQKNVLPKLAAQCPKLAEELHEDLCSGKNLFILATGASLNAALAAIPAFARFAGFVPTVLPASEAEYYMHLLKQATVLLISQSGGSFETTQLCARLQAEGIPFYGMTNEPDSVLAKTATKPILMQAEPEVSSATKTETASVFLLFLAAMGSAAGNDLPETVASATVATIDLCRGACLQVAQALLGKKTLYVLGDNINGPTARESALIFKEKCLIHAEGMTASEFRHGSVEVAEEALPVLMLAPTRSNRQEMEKHVTYLQGKGFDVYLAAPECFPTVPEDRYIPIVTSEEDTMGHLSAVIPAQFIAEELACRMGFDPDGFRFLTKVLANY